MKWVMIALALPLLGTWSQAKTYHIEKDYSIVEFHIRHLVSMTKGHFSDFEGKLDFDPAKPEEAQVGIQIKPGSIDTRNKRRDKHLRGKDFFDVVRYPTALYISQSVSRVAPDHFVVAGTLTLHGISKPVSLDVKLRGITTDPLGRSRCGFSVTTRINRKDFGITWNEKLDDGGFLLGDEVNIDIEMDAVER